MKSINLTYLTLAVLLTTLCISCNKPTEKSISDYGKIEEGNAMKKASTQDTISMHKFNVYTQNWASSGLNYSATKLPISFTMKKVDLTEVLGEQPTGARFYMGLEQTATESKAHLIMVGVDANGQDMLDYPNGEYAYDVTCPCPDVCPNGGGNVFKCTK